MVTGSPFVLVLQDVATETGRKITRCANKATACFIVEDEVLDIAWPRVDPFAVMVFRRLREDLREFK
jgi:hypothetical protein